MEDRSIAAHERPALIPLFPEQELAPPAFTFIDLFAGIGGIRIGLESVGGRCVYTVEFDRFAMQTYSINHGHLGPGGQRLPEPPRDIFMVDAAAVPPYTALVAGFPCQPFSIAGVSKNLSLGRQHGFDHEKSGNLFFEIVRLIDDAPSPSPVLFLENVKHLRRHDHGRTFAVIEATLKDRGYNVTSDVLDAQRWVPQHRERTFIIGLHRDVYGDQSFEFPAGADLPQPPWPTMEEVLEAGPVDPKYTLTDHLWQYLRDYAAKHRAAGNGFGFGMVDRQGVARTLSARYHKDGSEILVRQPGSNPRRLTPRECARLMGYPDTFAIPVSDTQAYRQFGNSVVVPVIRFLANALVEQGIIPKRGRTASIAVVRDSATALAG